jgi:histidine decarboxylase
VTPVFLWYQIQRQGVDGFRAQVQRCLDTAQHAVDRLTVAGRKAWRHRNSVTVVFPRPAEPVVRRWCLAVNEDIAHLITMPHVTRQMVDALVADVVAGPETPLA